MLPLADFFKKSGAFKSEFEKIAGGKDYSRESILKYISVCTKIIFSEVEKNYPHHNLRYINPIFIINKEIYPVPDVRGDINISKIARASEKLIESDEIKPLSLSIVESRVAGVCLFWHNGQENTIYNTFKVLDLHKLGAALGITNAQIEETTLINKIRALDAGKAAIEAGDFLNEIGVSDKEERIKATKTLVLYKGLAEALGSSMAFSFVNNAYKTESFNCLMTFVSQYAFNESELSDLANVIMEMSLPIDHYLSNNKGAQPADTKKRLEIEMEKRRAAIRAAIAGEVINEQEKDAAKG